MFFYDWTILLLIPGILLSMWAQGRVNSAYSRYSRVTAACGMTGAEVAQRMVVLRNGKISKETVNQNFTGKIRFQA